LRPQRHFPRQLVPALGAQLNVGLRLLAAGSGVIESWQAATCSSVPATAVGWLGHGVIRTSVRAALELHSGVHAADSHRPARNLAATRDQQRHRAD
jgi:hypothetical protein